MLDLLLLNLLHASYMTHELNDMSCPINFNMSFVKEEIEKRQMSSKKKHFCTRSEIYDFSCQARISDKSLHKFVIFANSSLFHLFFRISIRKTLKILQHIKKNHPFPHRWYKRNSRSAFDVRFSSTFWKEDL